MSIYVFLLTFFKLLLIISKNHVLIGYSINLFATELFVGFRRNLNMFFEITNFDLTLMKKCSNVQFVPLLFMVFNISKSKLFCKYIIIIIYI